MVTNYSTPHIIVKDEPFSKTVLMPGDPKRAEMIAETFLKDVKVVSDVRGIKAYKGIYIDENQTETEVTVMASGMGMPSIGLYAHELFNFFGVENIIRIGSAGAINKNLNLGDLIIAQAASTNSNYLAQFNLNGTYAPIADYDICTILYNEAIKCGKNTVVGNILSSDTFYGISSPYWEKLNVLGTEMESASLFTEAALAGKKAATICTVSDLIFDEKQKMSADDRQNNLKDMITIALNSVKYIEKKV